jgi:hypothetical protein
MGKKLNRSGLRQEKIQTKRGLRTYWVKAGAAAKRVGAALNKHKGKIAAGAAVAAGAYIAAKHGSKIAGAYHGAQRGLTMMNNVASALNTTASRREKVFGMALGAARGVSLGAKKDAARVGRIRDAIDNSAVGQFANDVKMAHQASSALGFSGPGRGKQGPSGLSFGQAFKTKRAARRAVANA